MSPFTCHDCGRTYQSRKLFLTHWSYQHRTRNSLKCYKCKEPFESSERRKEHYAKNHRSQRQPALRETPLTCSICNNRFKQVQSFKAHLETTHSNYRPFKCQCGKSFKRRREFTEHFATVHSDGKRDFGCSYCGKLFPSQNRLRTHVRRVHEKSSGRYKCETCSLVCFNNRELTDHIRKHTGERIFECFLCSAKFALQVTLRNHVKTHTKTQQACLFCSKNISSTRMQQHMAKNHGVYKLDESKILIN